jgi:hypothetical protein
VAEIGNCSLKPENRTGSITFVMPPKKKGKGGRGGGNAANQPRQPKNTNTQQRTAVTAKPEPATAETPAVPVIRPAVTPEIPPTNEPKPTSNLSPQVVVIDTPVEPVRFNINANQLSLVQGIPLAQRPPQSGTQGKPLTCFVNHYKFNIGAEQIYQYDTNFEVSFFPTRLHHHSIKFAFPTSARIGTSKTQSQCIGYDRGIEKQSICIRRKDVVFYN